MSHSAPRVIAVRNGAPQPSGSWLYVWIDIDSGAIVYVGATGLDPELRAHLHVESEDPRIGRVRATVHRYAERRFDVLAFEVPDGFDRRHAKRALIGQLADRGEYPREHDVASDLPDVTDPILQAIESHRGRWRDAPRAGGSVGPRDDPAEAESAR